MRLYNSSQCIAILLTEITGAEMDAIVKAGGRIRDPKDITPVLSEGKLAFTARVQVPINDKVVTAAVLRAMEFIN